MIAEIEEGQRLRGWITNSYAQIEFLLGDLILRCRSFHQYELHTKTMPHGGSSRVKKVKSILKINGPLSPFAGRLQTLLQRFDDTHDIRNLLAHGFCEYLFTPEGDAGLQFQKWHRLPNRDDARLIKTFRLNEMASEMDDFVCLSMEMMSLFKEIHDQFGWTARPDQ